MLAFSLSIAVAALLLIVIGTRMRRQARQAAEERRALAIHLERCGEHGCCRLASGPHGEPGYSCGQLCGHDGDCTWWTPGLFPFPPILHPLDLLRATIGLRQGIAVCPAHGARPTRDISIGLESPPTFIHDQHGEMWEPDYAAEVEFQPCGCRFRLA